MCQGVHRQISLEILGVRADEEEECGLGYSAVFKGCALI